MCGQLPRNFLLINFPVYSCSLLFHKHRNFMHRRYSVENQMFLNTRMNEHCAYAGIQRNTYVRQSTEHLASNRFAGCTVNVLRTRVRTDTHRWRDTSTHLEHKCSHSSSFFASLHIKTFVTRCPTSGWIAICDGFHGEIVTNAIQNIRFPNEQFNFSLGWESVLKYNTLWIKCVCVFVVEYRSM